MTFRRLSSFVRQFTRLLRACGIVFALLTLLVMQNAVLNHSVEHLVVDVKFSDFASTDPFSLQMSAIQVNSETDQPVSAGCQKCLEDVAHSFVLPAIAQLPHVDLSYVMIQTALPHNLPFLSPERANQRGPPLIG